MNSTRARALSAIVLATVDRRRCLRMLAVDLRSPTQTPTPTATATPTQTPTPDTSTPDPTAAPSDIPTDCNALGTASVRQRGRRRPDLQSDGVGCVRPAPANATLVLGCDWIVGDTTGMLLLISTAPPPTSPRPSRRFRRWATECGASEDFGAKFSSWWAMRPDTEEIIVAAGGRLDLPVDVESQRLRVPLRHRAADRRS